MTVSYNEDLVGAVKKLGKSVGKSVKNFFTGDGNIKRQLEILNSIKDVTWSVGDSDSNYKNTLLKYIDSIRASSEAKYVKTFHEEIEGGKRKLDKLFGKIDKLRSSAKKDDYSKECISLKVSEEGTIRTITISHKSADGYNDHDNVLTLKYISDYKDKAEERLELLDKRMAKLEKLILKK